jgi:hypothetical protein
MTATDCFALLDAFRAPKPYIRYRMSEIPKHLYTASKWLLQPLFVSILAPISMAETTDTQSKNRMTATGC